MPLVAAEQMVAYLMASRASLGALPTDKTIVAERFFDEAGGMQLVLHSPFGGRVNRAWGLALRKRFCRSFNFELQAAATDDGIILSLGQPHSFPLESVFAFLQSATVRDLLIQAMLPAPMFGVRWRWNATRSLAILRRSGGKKVPPHLLRMRADDLLGMVFPQQQACLENIVGDIKLPDHPLIDETVRDCLTEAMDIDRLSGLLAAIETQTMNTVATDTVEPSPLSHEIISANPYAFLDDAPLEERRTRAVTIRRGLKADPTQDIGKLDSHAIDAVRANNQPTVRDADELHDVLLSLYLLPDAKLSPRGWREWMQYLVTQNRATCLRYQFSDRDYIAWVAAERIALVLAALPHGELSPPLPALANATAPSPEQAIARIVDAHLEFAGPCTAESIRQTLGFSPEILDTALAALENDGAILRGHFTPSTQSLEWCNRRILAQIHRRTLNHLRSQIEPVSAAALMRFLFHWQRVRAGSQLHGITGLATVLEQLQGFESAAASWEKDLLPTRLYQYNSEWLDSLCLSGQITWCRLSARKPTDPDSTNSSEIRRATPTKSAPLAIMTRDALPWLRAPAASDTPASPKLTELVQQVFDHLRTSGASFLSEITSATGHRPQQIEDALWQLVAMGLAAADGFSSLRMLLGGTPGYSRSHFDAPAATQSRTYNRQWLKTLRHVRGRDQRRPTHAISNLPTAQGRWYLLGPPRSEDLDPEASARQLLCRYGVVFRDLVVRESTLPPWRELAIALRRLEARGEVRGGRFVTGFVGAQFALPAALEGLRAMRKEPTIPEFVRVAATDPLNLVGITSPGPRVLAVVGNAVLYKNGTPLASLEANAVHLRAALEPGAHVDTNLRYHAPPIRSKQPQISLPLLA